MVWCEACIQGRTKTAIRIDNTDRAKGMGHLQNPLSLMFNLKFLISLNKNQSINQYDQFEINSATGFYIQNPLLSVLLI